MRGKNRDRGSRVDHTVPSHGRRSLTEFCVGAENVQQDIGIDSGSQGLPRSSATVAFIEAPQFINAEV